MNRRFENGLIVGKFCPLHRGHELVIRRAMEECDRIFILSYTNPEFPSCEPERRERWLEQLFPKAERLVLTDERLRAAGGGPLPRNDASEEEHRLLVGWICEHVWKTRVDAVFTSENYGGPFAETLARVFGRPVQHVEVDLHRAQVPISGGRLREDIHAWREYLSPIVYASFVRRVCILGGESSGKTTLAEALAKDWRTEWAPEFGREHWVAKGGTLEFDDLLFIAQEQVAREEAASLRADRFVFCDTSPLTTLFYSREMFGGSDPRLDELARRQYDLTVLCFPEFPFVQDGTRRTSDFRESQHAWYVRELATRGVPYLLVSGSVRERVETIRVALLNKR